MLNIIDHEKQVLEFNNSIANILDEIIKPLNKYFNITHFHYNVFLNDGKRLYICNRFDWLKHYFSKHFQNNSNHARIYIKDLGTYKALWTSYKNDDIFSAIRTFNIWNGFSIFERTVEGIEAYHFATTCENTEINNFYLNNIHIFEKFINFFKNKIKEALKVKYKIAWIPSTIKTPLFKNNSNIEATISRVLNIKKYCLDDKIYITDRQLQILQYLSAGKTIKEIAWILEISPRTIETHLEIIKQRTNFSLKSDLIEMFLRNSIKL